MGHLVWGACRSGGRVQIWPICWGACADLAYLHWPQDVSLQQLAVVRHCRLRSTAGQQPRSCYVQACCCCLVVLVTSRGAATASRHVADEQPVKLWH